MFTEEMPVFDFLEAAPSTSRQYSWIITILARLTPISLINGTFLAFLVSRNNHLSTGHARMCASVSIFC